MLQLTKLQPQLNSMKEDLSECKKKLISRTNSLKHEGSRTYVGEIKTVTHEREKRLKV